MSPPCKQPQWLPWCLRGVSILRAPPNASAAASPAPIHLLHIEDNAEQALLVRDYLSNSRDDHFSLEWVPILRQGMQRLAQPGIDVVLLDLGLPELAGHRTHTAILAAAPLAPIVILTADSEPLSRDLAFLGGVVGYLVKTAVHQAFLRLRNSPLA